MNKYVKRIAAVAAVAIFSFAAGHLLSKKYLPYLPVSGSSDPLHAKVSSELIPSLAYLASSSKSFKYEIVETGPSGPDGQGGFVKIVTNIQGLDVLDPCSNIKLGITAILDKEGKELYVVASDGERDVRGLKEVVDFVRDGAYGGPTRGKARQALANQLCEDYKQK